MIEHPRLGEALHQLYPDEPRAPGRFNITWDLEAETSRLFDWPMELGSEPTPQELEAALVEVDLDRMQAQTHLQRLRGFRTRLRNATATREEICEILDYLSSRIARELE